MPATLILADHLRKPFLRQETRSGLSKPVIVVVSVAVTGPLIVAVHGSRHITNISGESTLTLTLTRSLSATGRVDLDAAFDGGVDLCLCDAGAQRTILVSMATSPSSNRIPCS
jgi:hypothetical protein